MRQVFWAPEALRDFGAQIAHIARQDEQGASLVAERIEAAAKSLAQTPAGRFGRMPGVYEKTVPRTSHIMVYSKTETAIYILRIIHNARNWTPEKWPDESE